jgi:hypothetical protein
MNDDELPSLGAPTAQGDLPVANVPGSSIPVQEEPAKGGLAQPSTGLSPKVGNIDELSKSIAKQVSESETNAPPPSTLPDDMLKLQFRREIVVSGFVKKNVAGAATIPTESKDTFVAGAIITVKDENNIPTKTLISDKDGFFKTNLMYAKNKYLMEISYPNMQFKPLALNLDDEQVKNLTIMAEASSPEPAK